MAERRMFSCKITNSDAFRTMSIEAQALYFHMGMEADDDGFVNNAVSIARSIGTNAKAIEEIVSKRFAIRMDEGLIVIKHWKINNQIRKDTYKPTTYQRYAQLLIVKENGAYTEKSKQISEEQEVTDDSKEERNESVTTPLQVRNESVTSPSQVRNVDKVSLGKVSLDKNSTGNPPIIPPTGVEEVKQETITTESSQKQQTDSSTRTASEEGLKAHDMAQVFQSWFNSINGVVKCERITVKREMAVDTILRNFTTEQIDRTFAKVKDSNFLKGNNDRQFVVNFDWLFNLDNFTKVLEGNYDNREAKKEAEKEKTSEETYGGMSKERYDAINKRNEELLAQIAEEERRNGTN